MRPAWDGAVEELARRVLARRPDVIIVAGDVAVADPREVVACLSLFSESPARRLVVPGNHDLWTLPRGEGADSLTIYEEIFPKAAALAGFHTLDQSPVVVGKVGFVGSVGWYDYGFADPTLGVPQDAYARKRLPGVGMWNDGQFVHWEHDDVSFTQAVLDRLREHLRLVREQVSCIVAVTHHLAFEQLVVRRADRAWGFHNAFMGSPRMGEDLLAEPKVRLNVCGHTHHMRRTRVGAIDAINIGSTYGTKRCLFFVADDDGARCVESEEVRAG
jgi:predicted phosphohydrolase